MTSNVESLESRRLLTVLPTGFAESLVAEGFDSPTAMAVAPDGRIFVAEQAGALRVVKNGSSCRRRSSPSPPRSRASAGCSASTFDPNFASNGFVYVYYTAPRHAPRQPRQPLHRRAATSPRPAARRCCFELDADRRRGQSTTAARCTSAPTASCTSPSATTADAAGAQQLTNLFGKMLRINPDGTIPTDNPFYDQTTGKNRAIWAFGLRNPFTFAFQPGTGRMFINDVGENTWEEINEGRAGANYGWPDSEGADDRPALHSPVYAYHHDRAPARSSAGRSTTRRRGAARSRRATSASTSSCDFDRRIDAALDPATKAVDRLRRPARRQAGGPRRRRPTASLYYLSRAVTDVSRPACTASATPAARADASARSRKPDGVGRAAGDVQRVGDAGRGRSATSGSATGSNISRRDAVDATRCRRRRWPTAARRSAWSSPTPPAAPPATRRRSPSRPTAPPTATITAPAAGTLYYGGTTINFAGTGTDPEDGTLPASAFTWRVDFHHDDHTHPFVGPSRTATSGGSFTIPDDRRAPPTCGTAST